MCGPSSSIQRRPSQPVGGLPVKTAQLSGESALEGDALCVTSEPAHLALHPFGQIRTYEEGDLAVFESGAIVLHVAQRHAGLLPDEANARARAITWMFAALSTMEPPIVEREVAMLLERNETWHKQRLPAIA